MAWLTRRDSTKKRTNSMRNLVGSVIVALSVGAWGCGSSTPTTPTNSTPAPTPTPTAPSGVVTINIVGINGAQSFSPNPATLPAGQMVVWHNSDSITHRVVLNDGSLDTGDIAGGASSQPMAINSGGPYHCSIHPVMVGTIAPAAAAAAYAR
jgi:plastocyanin